MNKKGFLLATSAGFAFAPAAHAADMPLRAPPPPLPPAPIWTGFYIGGHLGCVWQQAQNTLSGNFTAGYFGSQVNATPTTTASGFIGGGQIGYNWQHGSYVLGVEADISKLSGKGTATQAAAVFDFDKGLAFSNQIRWLSTVRTRSGLAFGDTMAYVTGGFAWGGVRNSFTLTNPGCCNQTYSESKTRVGWTVGFGVEHMWDQHFTIAA